MRIWDLPEKLLCDKHLLGQHREIHAIYNMITQNKGGNYLKHPEVKRWKGKIPALCVKHADTAYEMEKRGFKHFSQIHLEDGGIKQNIKWQSIEEQKDILRIKQCKCEV